MRGDPLYVGTPQQALNSVLGSVFWWWLWLKAGHFITNEVVPFWYRLKADKRRYDFVRAFDLELDW